MKLLLLPLLVLLLIPVTWGHAASYSIALNATMPTVEQGMMSLITATCLDGAGVSHNETVTFTVESVKFKWIPSRGQYEGIARSSIAQTKTFNVLDSLSDSANATSTGNVTVPASVTWTTNRIDSVLVSGAAGDLTGVFWGMTIFDLGATFAYTFIALAVSVALYNHSGPEPVLILWLLMWGGWSVVVHGTAAEIGIIFLVLGGGLLIAKIYLDRRQPGG